MHILQPKHTKLKDSEVKELLSKFNITSLQLPKIKAEDPSLPEGCVAGDVIKVERKSEGKKAVYYRIVIE